MIFPLFITFLLFSGISYFGYLIISIFRYSGSFISKIGLSFLIGSGIFSYLFFGFNLLGFTFDLKNTVVLLVVLLVILIIGIFLVFRFSNRKDTLNIRTVKLPELKFNIVEGSLLLLILGIVGSTFLVNSYWPVKDWDALTLYDFRARVYVEQGFIENSELSAYYLSYPLYTSIMHAFFYISGVSNPMIFYSLLFSAFLLVFYDAVRVFCSRLIALFLTLLISISPLIFEHATVAYTNLGYTVFLILGTIYLYLFIRLEKKSFLFIAALLTGLSTWVRTAEPFWLVNLGIAGLFIVIYNYRKFKKDYLKIGSYTLLMLISYALIFFILQLPWRLYLLNFVRWDQVSPLTQVSQGVIIAARTIDLNHLSQVLDYAYRFTIYPLLPLFLVFVFGILYQLLMRKNILFGIIILMFMALFIVGLYVFSGFFDEWETIHGSLARMSMLFAPLLIYFIATLFNERNLKR